MLEGFLDLVLLDLVILAEDLDFFALGSGGERRRWRIEEGGLQRRW